ncbi:MAG: hypothetical protein CMN32_05895 [Saprospirales bacterium]|nr:hypothetical protein [Saprospirales bacterium]
METLQRKASSETTQRLYRLIAPVYDVWSMLTERKALNRVLELAEIKDGENILEVACGTGWLFKKVVQRNPSGRRKIITFDFMTFEILWLSRLTNQVP